MMLECYINNEETRLHRLRTYLAVNVGRTTSYFVTDVKGDYCLESRSAEIKYYRAYDLSEELIKDASIFLK